jgi:hypothetical protein
VHPKEWIMGDPAYGNCPHVTVKYRKHKLCSLIHRPLQHYGVDAHTSCNCPKGRLPGEKVSLFLAFPLSFYLTIIASQVYNTVFDSYRGRVEKIFAKVVNHKLFMGKCALHYDTLTAAVQITVHTTAVWCRNNPQYPGYGDWGHFD